MTSTMQPDRATVPATTNKDQPSTSSAAPALSAPAPSAPVPAPASAKAAGKRVLRTPAKKVAAPAKPVAQVAIKPVARKTAPRAAVKSVGSTTPTVPAKAEPKTAIAATAKQAEVKLLKAKKTKLVRDSFTIPKLEYLKLEELKHRGVKLGASVKKSELIRAGIMALATMSDANFMKAIKAVPAIKTGRPAKD